MEIKVEVDLEENLKVLCSMEERVKAVVEKEDKQTLKVGTTDGA